MLVKERMSTPVISVAPNLPIMEALNLMKREEIRRAPVMKNGRMVGIVSKSVNNLRSIPKAANTSPEYNNPFPFIIYILSQNNLVDKDTIPG